MKWRTMYQMGKEHCRAGKPSSGHLLIGEAKEAYEAGYAKQYEKEQQLTNMTEGQEDVCSN